MQHTQSAPRQARSVPTLRRLGTALALTLTLLTASASALDDDDGGLQAQVRLPKNLSAYVRDMDSAIALGKALYWEEAAGSDGRVSCATCHWAAGADVRVEDSINPGPNGIFEEDGTRWPFESDDIFGSQGVALAEFEAIVPGQAVEMGTPEHHPIFGDKRQVTGRNAPSAVNAAVYRLQFWDGRAANTFNGVNGSGSSDSSARLLEADGNGGVKKVKVAIQDASLASQAVGPVLSEVEMSFAGRTLPDVGKKLFSLQPLARQVVHPEDSVLGPYKTNSTRTGLAISYGRLVREAFQPRWWDSDVVVDRDLNVVGAGDPQSLDEFTLMESNFSLFWGLAINLYEATLIADQSPYDAFLAGDSNALSQSAKRGLEVYEGDGRCDKCHMDGPALSAAASDDSRAFTNTGVRPVNEDPGKGDGEFKSVTVRLNELNGPYFHTGGYLTLRQVVDFYDRGGDFPNDETDSQVRELELTEKEKNDLVQFMLETTDPRVTYQAAPFDHPSLNLPGGGRLRATGAAGGAPLQPFLNADPFEK